MNHLRLLVTGMSGLIGGLVRQRLEGKYELRALNRSPIEGVACHRADIADFDAIRPAFDGIDVVVHLAALARSDATWDELLPANIVGTYNVFEAARQAGVKRIVYASSGATVAGYERDEPYRSLVTGQANERTEWTMLTHLSEVRPNGLYGVTKCFGEALARFYVDEFGLSILCLRIGSVTREDRPATPRQLSVYCSQRDVATMIELCVAAPESLRFDTFFVTSRNHWSYRDLDHAREVLGFVPEGGAAG